MKFSKKLKTNKTKVNVETIECFLNQNKKEIYFSNLILIYKGNTTVTWQVMKEIVSKRKHNIQKFPITPIMNKNSVFDEKLIAYSRNTYN